MKKDLGILQAVYPMPVLMIATYEENGRVDVMNNASGNISALDKIAFFICEAYKTTKNIRAVKAFTVSIADKAHVDEGAVSYVNTRICCIFGYYRVGEGGYQCRKFYESTPNNR